MKLMKNTLYHKAVDVLLGGLVPTVLQFGGNDGKTNDPLFDRIKKHNMPGLICEPMPDSFQRLKANYGGCKIQLWNVAIGKEDGKQDMYFIDEAKVGKMKKPGNPSGVSSFSQTHVLNGIERLVELEGHLAEYYMGRMSIPVISMETLIERCPIKPDIIQVDIEGYDHIVIEDWDFSRRPAIINYESGSLPETKKIETWFKLKDLQYRVFRHGKSDILALREDCFGDILN